MMMSHKTVIKSSVSTFKESWKNSKYKKTENFKRLQVNKRRISKWMVVCVCSTKQPN